MEIELWTSQWFVGSENYYFEEGKIMRILIVEDEPPIANEIEQLTRSLLGRKLNSIYQIYTIEEVRGYLQSHSIDLCLLDLNLSGKNGYDILQYSVSEKFHTIIISAHTEQAIEAFHYGVLDFVPKPVEKDRLREAFDRYLGRVKTDNIFTKFIVVRKQNNNHLIAVDEILYFKAVGYLVEIHLNDGGVELIEKPLNRLEQILPSRFMRVHRSYITDMHQIASYRHKGGGVYQLTLENGTKIPLSPDKYKFFQTMFGRK
jgi:two-component system response regulator LytT